MITLKLMAMKVQSKFREFISNERGDVNIVSIVVLIGIAVLLAILFKDQIAKLLKSMFEAISENATNTITTEV